MVLMPVCGRDFGMEDKGGHLGPAPGRGRGQGWPIGQCLRFRGRFDGFADKTTHFLLIHRAQHSGNRPHVIHDKGIGLITKVNRKIAVVETVFHCFASFKRYALVCPIILFGQKAGNFGVAQPVPQPGRHFVYPHTVQQPTLTCQHFAQIVPIISGANL